MKTINSLKPLNILSAVSEHKLIKITDHGLESKKDLVNFGQSLGKLLLWDFGVINELKAHKSPVNYLYSHEEVPFHWDGAFHVCPHLLIFHCIKAPNLKAGGETLFVNTENVYKSFTSKERSLYSKLTLCYQTEKKTHYGGTIETPFITKHPKTMTPTLRYAEPVNSKLNPVSLRIKNKSVQQEESFKKKMKSTLYDSRFCYTHPWSDNELIIADNHSLLHGRNKFTKHSERHIRRVQVI